MNEPDIKKEYAEGLEGTNRIEAFSDGVIAIIVTILILEIHVPSVLTLSNQGAWLAIIPILPKLLGFLVSFVTVAIFWVNHHHFFHSVKQSDAALLWHNNHLLFWLAVVPFVTDFIGDYSEIPLVVALYGFVLFMGAFAFLLMTRHVYFQSALLPEEFSLSARKAQYRRSWIGVILYGLSVVLAFIHPYISFAVFFIVPLYYFIPRRIEEMVL